MSVSEAGIAAGAVPNPSDVPAIFMIGQIVTGDVMLREIEKTLRAHFTRDYHPGTIIHFHSDPKDERLPVNPVLQAKVMAIAFNVGKGQWLPYCTSPPRRDPVRREQESHGPTGRTAGAAGV